MNEATKQTLVDYFNKLVTITNALREIDKQEKITDSDEYYYLDVAFGAIYCATEDLGQALYKDLGLEVDWSNF